MAKNKELTLEEKLKEALIPKEEQPYEIPENWEWGYLLSSFAICLDNFRKPINSEERAERKGNIPYYGATGQVGWIDDYLTDEELVLVGEDGAPFLNPFKKKAYLISGKSWVNNHAHILKSLYKNAGNSYLVNYLNCFDYKNYVSGTTRLKLTQASLKKIPIPIPPLKEQKRIVEKLDSIFEKINKAKELIQEVKEKIENRKESILNKAFRGELTAEWRKNNQTEDAIELLKSINEEKIKNWEQACIEAEKNGKKKPSKPKIEEIQNMMIPKEEVPYEIPKNWKWTKLRNICFSFIYGTSEKSSVEGKIPVIRMGNLQKGKIIYKNLVYTSNSLEIEKYKLKKGDILFNRTNSPELVGKTALFDGEQNCIYAGYLIKIEFPQNRVIPYYFNQYMQTNYIKQVCLNVKSDGVSQSNINAQKLSNFIFPLPPLKEQEEIVRILDEILEKESKIKELIELEEAIELLEKSILDKAFRGKLGTQNKEDEPAIALLKKIL